MNLLFLQIILTIWTGMAIVNVILVLVAIMMLLMNSNIQSVKKLIWTLVIILIPILGSLVFFTGRLAGSNKETIS